MIRQVTVRSARAIRIARSTRVALLGELGDVGVVADDEVPAARPNDAFRAGNSWPGAMKNSCESWRISS